MSRLLHRHTSSNKIAAEAQHDSLKGFDVEEITIVELQQHFVKNHFTIADYIGFCLERIRRLDPYLHTVIEVNPEAMKIAQKLDEDRSWALLGSVVPRDAFVIRKLRQAGAVILGHTNMSEWASARSKSYSTGYSPRGGQTRNPFNLRKTPFGSSSGSAVAVSANLVPLTFGTETDTSIIGPASINGVVGIKPTVGLTSRTGVVPVSENFDSVGSFGRTVEDAVMGLDAIVGHDPEDPFSRPPEDLQHGSYAKHLSNREVLKGARFGLPIKRVWDLCPADCKAVVSKVLEVIRENGAEVIEVDLPSVEERIGREGTWNWEHGEPSRSEWTVAKIDAYNGINAYLKGLTNTAIGSIEDVIVYNEKNNGTEGASPGVVPAFPSGQDNFVEIMQNNGKKDSTYYSALQHVQKQTRKNGIDAALLYDKDPNRQLDALIFCDRRGVGQQYAAQAGYPIICIPIGLDQNDMPVSLSFQQSACKEAELVKWASAVEDAWNVQNGWRATPQYKNLTAKNIPIEKLT